MEEAKEAALEVLLHNSRGPYHGLPRTAGWGYPEPYTRDLMISSLGVLTTGNEHLLESLRQVLVILAQNQTGRGHVPSLVHDSEDRGASDTAPLFLLAIALYRRATGDEQFLQEAAEKALTWMSYQSPEDMVMVAQQPTSDWRDEQWVSGFGLYVNAVWYSDLVLYGLLDEARTLRGLMNRFEILEGVRHRHVHEGLSVPRKPYYALWSYKIWNNERFDLLGNSLAVLSGIGSPTRARKIVAWVEAEAEALREKGLLAVEMPPCLMPFMQEGDPDWRPRYAEHNPPGCYHNGGVWPFVCGFYVAALVAAGRHKLARRRLVSLTRLVEPAREADVRWGFNEWSRAQDGEPSGQDWQSWSAAMYLYAAACVQEGRTPFFDEVRRFA